MKHKRNGQALIVGWGGSSPRDLAPVAESWQTRGYAPLVWVPPFPRTLFDPRPARALLEHQARALIDGEGPAIVHLFSNNGFVAYANLLRRLRKEGEEPTLARITHVLLDSAPWFPQPFNRPTYVHVFHTGTRGILLHALGRDPQRRTPLTDAAMRAFYSLHYLLYRPLIRNMGNAEATIEKWQTAAPWLLLGMRDDPIIPVVEIEGFADRQRKRGIAVAQEWFSGCGHVAAFRRQADAYWARIDRFVGEGR